MFPSLTVVFLSFAKLLSPVFSLKTPAPAQSSDLFPPPKNSCIGAVSGRPSLVALPLIRGKMAVLSEMLIYFFEADWRGDLVDEFMAGE